MDYEHLTGYKSAEERERHNRLRETNLTKEERRAIYKASFAKFLPPFLCFVAAFAVVLVLIYVFALN